MSDLIFNSDLYGTVGFIPYPVSDGAVEALEFDTDILGAYSNAAEDRNQMRAIPRQSFAYSYVANLGNMQEIYNALWKNLRGKWLIPLWFECQLFAASSGQTDIPCDTLLHDLRANTHALIFQSICNWQVVKIGAITDTSITCDELTIDGSAYIVPFRIGSYSGNAGLTPTGYRNNIKASFFVDDVLTGLTQTVTQYNGLDLYTVPYLINTAGSTQIIFQETQTEFKSGDIDRSTSWLNSQYQKQYMLDDQGVAAYRDLKNYFYRRAGSFRSFYSPTFESNLQCLSTGNITNVLKYKDEGYTDELFDLRKTLAFGLNDGTWQIRTVDSVTHLGGGIDQLNLHTNLNQLASKIACISFLAENRLDTDRLEITLSQNANFRASLNVLELSP